MGRRQDQTLINGKACLPPIHARRVGVPRIEKTNIGPFKEPNQEHPGQKTADMRKKGHAAALLSDTHAAAQNLHKKPEAKHPSGPDVNHACEKSKWNQDQHLRMRVEQQVGAQKTGDRPARTDHRDHGTRIGYRMAHCGNQTAQKIKNNEAPMPHHIFNIVPKNPEIQHISGQMHESAVQKHAGKKTHDRRQNRDFSRKRLLAKKHRRNRPVLINKDLLQLRAKGELVEKNQNIDGNKTDTKNGLNACRVVISKWNHLGSSAIVLFYKSVLWKLPDFHPTGLFARGQSKAIDNPFPEKRFTHLEGNTELLLQKNVRIIRIKRGGLSCISHFSARPEPLPVLNIC